MKLMIVQANFESDTLFAAYFGHGSSSERASILACDIVICYSSVMKYTIVIEKDLETATYTGQCLEVTAGIGQGITPDECKNNTIEATRLVLQYLKEQADHLKSMGEADILIVEETTA